MSSSSDVINCSDECTIDYNCFIITIIMAKNLVQCNYCTHTLKRKTKPIDMNNKHSVYNHKRYHPDCK